LKDPGFYFQKKQSGLVHSSGYTWEKSAQAMMKSILNALK
jgi:hypothetical protein